MKITHDYIQRKRTEGTVFAVNSKIKGIPTEELITDLFLYTEDKIAMELVKRFESVLVKASMDSNFLKNNLHDFYIDNAKFLKENKLYKKFAEFTYFIYSNHSSGKSHSGAFSAYQDLLLQQFCYLAPPGKMVYGVTNSDELMMTDEVYPFLDYPVHEINDRNIKGINEIEKTFKKYGYSLETIENWKEIISNERLLTNMVFEMANFINEETFDIFPEKLFMPSRGVSRMREWKNTETYKSMLKKRKYILPPDGVLGIYRNTGKIYSIFFKELFMDSQVYLLYRIENNEEEGLYGIYDIKNDFFYSIYKDSTGESLFHNFIENFILESYCHLTTDIEIDRKRNMALKVVEDINNVDFCYPNQPVVQFMYKEKGKTADTKEKKYRNYDKSRYKEMKVTVNPYIRRLPQGAVASQEAIDMAREYGYELSEGETFVRPFSRRTFVLKEEQK